MTIHLSNLVASDGQFTRQQTKHRLLSSRAVSHKNGLRIVLNYIDYQHSPYQSKKKPTPDPHSTLQRPLGQRAAWGS